MSFSRSSLRSAKSAFTLKSAQSPLLKAERLYQNSKFADAIELYENHILKNPTDYNGFIGKGKSLDKIKYHQEALKIFDIAIKINASSPVAYNYKGKSFHSLGKFTEALKCFDTAIKLDPKYDQVYCSKGTLN